MGVIIHKSNFSYEERVIVNVDLTFSYMGEGSDGYSRKTKIARNLKLPRWIEGIINKGERYAVLLTKCDFVDGRYILRGKELYLDRTTKIVGNCSNLYFINSNGEEEYCSTFLPKDDNMRACLNASKHINRETTTKEITLSYRGYTVTSYHKEVTKDEVISCPQYIRQYFEIKNQEKEIILDSKKEVLADKHQGKRDGLYHVYKVKTINRVEEHKLKFDHDVNMFVIVTDTFTRNILSESETKIAETLDVKDGIRFKFVKEHEEEYINMFGDGFRRGLKMKRHVEAHYEIVPIDVIYYDNGEVHEFHKNAMYSYE